MIMKVLLMILLSAFSFAAGPARVWASPATQRITLPNGLNLIVSERHQLPTIHIQVLVRAGTSLDQADTRGLANLTAELLPQGTLNRTAPRISREIESVGGALSSGTDLDYATIGLSVLKKDLALGLDLLADILLQPIFDQHEIERKVTELKARIQRMDEEPRQIARLAFDKNLFGNHPYAYPIEGSLETLPALTRNRIKQFYETYYRPNNSILVIVGDVHQEEASQLIQAYLGGWKSGPLSPPLPAPAPELTRPVIIKIDRPISQANLVWGHEGVTRSNPDFYALQVMNYILGGGGFVSRLMDSIRDNLGLTYGIYSHFEARQQPGSFRISLQTKNQNANQAISEVQKELKKFLDQGITPTELAEAKAYLTGSFPLKMDTNGKLVQLLTAMEFYGLGLDYPEKFPELINRVTAEEVLRVARKYLHPGRFLLVVVGNQKEINLKESW